MKGGCKWVSKKKTWKELVAGIDIGVPTRFLHSANRIKNVLASLFAPLRGCNTTAK